jgi:hypothetical protein
MNVPIAFWLIPEARRHASFTEVIERLACAHGTPTFEPHVTLHVAETIDSDDDRALLDGFADRFATIELVAGDTGHSDARFKTLFVELHEDNRSSGRLTEMQRALRTGLELRSEYKLAPHLSLLYCGQLQDAVRQALALEYRFRGQSIRFDQIAAVRPGTGRQDWEDVSSWEVSLRRSLRACPANESAKSGIRNNERRGRVAGGHSH